jgi:uncharacterized iron-regulated membrane protein
MRYSRFLFWNATGGIVWAALMGTLGYLFGQQLPLLEQLVGRFGFGLLAALLLFIAARVAWSRREQLAAWWAHARSQPLDLGALRQIFLRRWRLAAIGIGLAVVGGAGLALALLTDVM